MEYDRAAAVSHCHAQVQPVSVTQRIGRNLAEDAHRLISDGVETEKLLPVRVEELPLTGIDDRIEVVPHRSPPIASRISLILRWAKDSVRHSPAGLECFRMPNSGNLMQIARTAR